MVLVRSPIAGRANPLEAVADPVFASGMLGAGIVIDPLASPLPPALAEPDAASSPSGTCPPGAACAPVSGILAAVQPHAYAIQPADGPAILVHLGIDTVTLVGAGFTALAERGVTLAAGEGVIAWDPEAVLAAGLSPLVPVIAMQSDQIRYLIEPGAFVAAGDPIFEAD